MIKLITCPDYLQSILDKEVSSNASNESHKTSFTSHLKSAIYDWRVERQWNKPYSFIYSFDDKGFIFFTYTQKFPRHCTLRHIFVKFNNRVSGVGTKLFDFMKSKMNADNVNILRMFINPPALRFYQKHNIKNFHGKSKTGLDFYYGDINGNLISLPKSQKRYVVKNDDGNKLSEWIY